VDDQTLFRAAGLSAALAIPLLIISGVALALFFGGQGAFWGPVNDVFISLTVIALLLPIIAVDRLAADAAPWLRVVSIVAVLSCILIAAGQFALVVGVIDLNTSFVTGGIGFLGIIAWLIALVVLTFGQGVLPAPVGWLSLAVLAGIVLETGVGLATTGAGLWVASVVLLAGLVAWLGTLAAGLLARAPTA
jgi:hypothetical protein